MKSILKGAQILFLVCLFFSGCVVGRRHTSDSRLEQNFFRHEAQFNALRAEVHADRKLEMISLDEGRYADRAFTKKNEREIHEFGLTEQRLTTYRQQLRQLDIVQVFREDGSVTFKVDWASILNGDSFKGYVYSVTQPDGHLKADLDGYRISDADRDHYGNYIVYKPLKDNWYLFLFVDGSR